MARSRVARVSGRYERALIVCWKYAIASRWADRAIAFSRLLAICQGLAQQRAPDGVMGQPFHVLRHPVSGEFLQGRDDACHRCV